MDISARAVTKPFGFKPTPAGIVTYTREDIIHSVRAAEDVGEIEEAEEEMLYKVFDFADKEVSEVMLPRPEVVAISVDLPPEDALAALIDSQHATRPTRARSTRSWASCTFATSSRRCTTAASSRSISPSS